MIVKRIIRKRTNVKHIKITMNYEILGVEN